MVPAFLAFVLVNCVLVRLSVVRDIDLLLVVLPVSLAGLRFRRCRVLAPILLQPEYVVVSAGYQNRFGHPHDNVMNRYQNRQIKSFNTAVDGAVKFHLDRRHVQVVTARADQPFIWRRHEHHDTRGNL